MGIALRFLRWIWRRIGDAFTVRDLLDLFDLKTAVFAFVGFVAMMMIAATNYDWSAPTVVLAALAAAILLAILAIALRLLWQLFQKPKGALGDNKTVEQLQGLVGQHDVLRLEFGEDGHFESITKHNLYGITRQFNLRLQNRSRSESVSDCKIQIMGIEPDSGARLPRLLKEGFSLAAGDQAFVPLASYGEAREPEKFNCADTLIEVFGADRSYRRILVTGGVRRQRFELAM